MKNFFFFLLILFAAKTANAQFDTIVMVTGQKLPVIVKEISDKYIKYKHPLDSLGPTLVIKKKLIEKFILRNGCIELKEIGYDNCVKDPTYGVLKEDEFKRRLITIDFAQLATANFHLNLEYVFKKRNFGIVLIGNKGLLDAKFISKKSMKEKMLLLTNPVSNNRNSYYYKVAYGGVQLKVYPSVHKKATYFMSFGIDFGKALARVETEEPIYYSYNTWGSSFSQQFSHFQERITFYESYFQSLSYVNGVVFRPSKHTVIQLSGLVGVNRFIDPPAPSYMVQHSEKHATYFVRYGIGLSAGFAF